MSFCGPSRPVVEAPEHEAESEAHLRNGIYKATLTIGGEAIEGELVVIDGKIEGIGKLAGVTGSVAVADGVTSFVIDAFGPPDLT